MEIRSRPPCSGTYKFFLSSLLEGVAERCLIIFEGAHLLELLLHAAASFKSQPKDFREFFLGHIAVREVLPQFVWRGGSIRALSSSGPALPYIARLRVLRRLI